MGTDIHVMVERYNRKENKWENVSIYTKSSNGEFKVVDIYIGRNYHLFGMLAGVRGSYDETLVGLRGLPDDISDDVKKYWDDYSDCWHSATWYDYCELRAYEDTMKKLDKCMKELVLLRSEDSECDDLDDDISGYDCLNDFMNSIRFVMDAYKIWYPCPGEVRVIVWFDS